MVAHPSAVRKAVASHIRRLRHRGEIDQPARKGKRDKSEALDSAAKPHSAPYPSHVQWLLGCFLSLSVQKKRTASSSELRHVSQTNDRWSRKLFHVSR